MIDFLAGALTLAYLVASAYFIRFWRRTTDKLFLAFAAAFALLALNQIVVFAIGVNDERHNYAYVLRVLGFLIILAAVVHKNLFERQRGKS